MSDKIIHLHLISDSTGETLGSIARAVFSQFNNVSCVEHGWPFVNTKSQIDRIIEAIQKNPGPVIYTILKQDLIDYLNTICKDENIICIPALNHIIKEISKYLNIQINQVIGRQHELDDEYFRRIDAINYTLAHDDSKSWRDLEEADIILIGVSRTSKTPTSVYLSYKGLKTANIPFVYNGTMPDLMALKKPLIIGLIIDPQRLVLIRQSRMISLNQNDNVNYTQLDYINKELLEARRLFARLNCPVIDVTKRSVEEIAANIIKIHRDTKGRDIG